jgi:hypothetical protein
MNETAAPPPDDDLPAEIDFSGATRGKFYRPGAKLNLPIYLEADVQAHLAALASRKGVPLSELANDLLKKDITILESAASGDHNDSS